MKIFLQPRLLANAYTPLTPSRRQNTLHDKPHHHRKGSLPFSSKTSVRSIQNPGNKSFKKGSRKACKDNTLSPKMSTMKSLVIKDIYGSKNLGKSMAYTSKLASTLRSNRPMKEVRHSSTGAQLRMKTQRKSFIGATSVRHNLFKNKRHSENLSYSLHKGLEKLKNRKLEQAIECFDKSIAVMPNTPHAYFHRGIAYFESGITAKALKDFEKVADEWPKYNKSTFLYLSMIYVKIADISSAIASVCLLVTKCS